MKLKLSLCGFLCVTGRVPPRISTVRGKYPNIVSVWNMLRPLATLSVCHRKYTHLVYCIWGSGLRFILDASFHYICIYVSQFSSILLQFTQISCLLTKAVIVSLINHYWIKLLPVSFGLHILDVVFSAMAIALLSHTVHDLLPNPKRSHHKL